MRQRRGFDSGASSIIQPRAFQRYRFIRVFPQIATQFAGQRLKYLPITLPHEAIPKCEGTLCPRGPQCMQAALILALVLFRRFWAHAFHGLGLAGDADIGARDLPGVVLADDAAVRPRRATGRTGLDSRIIGRHGGRQVRHHIGRRQLLLRGAIGTRRLRGTGRRHGKHQSGNCNDWSDVAPGNQSSPMMGKASRPDQTSPSPACG